MKHMKHSYLLAVLLLLGIQTATAQKAAHKGYDVTLTVSDKDSHEPIIMATIQLQPTGTVAVTNADGRATLRNIEPGNYTINISYVGYEPTKTNVKVNGPLNMNFQMTPTTLALREVNVVAKQKAGGASTTSVIGRQAIDHLQASSLADIMQLIPGQLMTNPDLTSQSNLQIRTLSNNNTAAFGSGVIVDGMPVSNNGTLSAGSVSTTAFTGTDLRNFSADDIDEVEVIRGIPSAEYGDLTSGLMVVKSKIGVTPWQLKGKINPGLMNYSLGKGLRMNRYGVLNFNVDYAQAWGDPRLKTKSFDRYTLSAGYGLDITRKWHTDTKVRYMYAKDWSGDDPDLQKEGIENRSTNQTLTLTHNGRISVDKLFSRNINYTIGLTLTASDTKNMGYQSLTNGVVHILTTQTTGYHQVPWQDMPYLATGYTESRPGNFYAKVNNSFYIKSGKVNQRFKMGIDYHYDWNSGKGFYNDDENLPYKLNDSSRPRAFSDVPGLHQFAAYIEDNMTWNYAKGRNVRLQLGARFSAMQPFSDVRTFALSPRLNASIDVTKWLVLRAGIGLNSKTPGLNYLYPDKKYRDIATTTYYHNSSLSPSLYPASVVEYYTYVYDVESSKNLKNATTTKIEVGADIRLPGNRKLSITAYQDRTPNGFANASEFLTFMANKFSMVKGDGMQPSQYNITPGSIDPLTGQITATTIDYNNPDQTPNVYWMTTGRMSNDNVLVNRGIEFDFDLGRINPINTNLYLSGAWQESKYYSTGLNSESPNGLPSNYNNSREPYRLLYPSGKDFSRNRQFVSTLRLVTNIPALRMVASFTGQVIWHSSTYSYVAYKRPYAFMTQDMAIHAIPADQLTGYMDMNGNWSAAIPATDYIDMEKQKQEETDNEPTTNPITWNLSARLTKEFGRYAGLSFYCNNVLYYEPFMSTNKTGTLTQRNTNSFSFGVELFFNL